MHHPFSDYTYQLCDDTVGVPGRKPRKEQGWRAEGTPGHRDSRLHSTCALPPPLPGSPVGLSLCSHKLRPSCVHLRQRAHWVVDLMISRGGGSLEGSFSFAPPAEGKQNPTENAPPFLFLTKVRTRSQLEKGNGQGAATDSRHSACARRHHPCLESETVLFLAFPKCPGHQPPGHLCLACITTCWLPAHGPVF